MSNTGFLLEATLSAAVPLWIHEFRNVSRDRLMQIAGECSQIVAEKGDVILYKSKKKGATAYAFNALAKGLACCAFVPGGVRFLNLHFEAVHPERLSDADIEEIRRSLGRGAVRDALACEFGVDPHEIDLVGEAPL